MRQKRSHRAALAACLLCLCVSSAYAEDRNAATATATAKPELAASPPVPARAVSLLFTSAEMQRIRESLDVFARRDFSGDYLQQLAPPPAQAASVSYTYPQFYLESLVYHAPTRWSIRLNGRVFSFESPGDGDTLRVTGIDKLHVQMEWKPSREDMRQLASVPLAPGPTQWETPDRSVITFLLRPNQTFSSASMTVQEGKFLPVTVVSATPPAKNP